MWCTACRQDVPGLGSSSPGSICCARCGTVVSSSEWAAHTVGLAETADHGLDLSATQSVSNYPNFEEWEIDQNFRHLQARVGTARRSRSPAKLKRAKPDAAPSWHIHGAHSSPRRPHKSKAPRSRRTSLTAWIILSLGLLAFACGAMLLGWSFIEHRPELWNLGLQITIGGQAALLLSLVLQLERIWKSSRYAARKLESVDAQLHELQRTTAMLHVTHGSAAQAFYAHMADEADPRLLLADLKGQLDLLATSMAKRSA